LVPGKSNINATAMRTAIAAPNTRCDKGVIHGSRLFRDDPAPFVGQLDGTGSTKVRHAHRVIPRHTASGSGMTASPKHVANESTRT
jgi:hypothetical protein